MWIKIYATANMHVTRARGGFLVGPGARGGLVGETRTRALPHATRRPHAPTPRRPWGRSPVQRVACACFALPDPQCPCVTFAEADERSR